MIPSLWNINENKIAKKKKPVFRYRRGTLGKNLQNFCVCFWHVNNDFNPLQYIRLNMFIRVGWREKIVFHMQTPPSSTFLSSQTCCLLILSTWTRSRINYRGIKGKVCQSHFTEVIVNTSVIYREWKCRNITWLNDIRGCGHDSRRCLWWYQGGRVWYYLLIWVEKVSEGRLIPLRFISIIITATTEWFTHSRDTLHPFN